MTFSDVEQQHTRHLLSVLEGSTHVRKMQTTSNKDDRRATPWIVSVPVVVSDREAAKKWYTEKLGLALVENEGHWVTVGGGSNKGSVLHLCAGPENQPKPIPLEPGPSGIVIAIPGDFRTECRRLMDAGVDFSQPPVEAPWGWYAAIRDPDGNEHYLAAAH